MENEVKEEYYDIKPPIKDKSVTNPSPSNEKKLIEKDERIVENLKIKHPEKIPSNNVMIQEPAITPNM